MLEDIAMTRRTIRLLIALALSLLVAPLAADAQHPTKVFRLGFISSSVTNVSHPFLTGLRQGLSELGYKESKNITMEYRFGTTEELPKLAEELVRLQVDVIIAGGSEGIMASQKATQTIPIVMTNSGHAVQSGLVASLMRPGGNITGMTQISPELAAKRLELLQETVPGFARVAVLWYPLHPNTPELFKETQAASQKLGLQLFSLEVKTPEDFAAAFAMAIQQRAEALIVLRDPFIVRHRAHIADLALASRLPAMYETRDFLEAGGLILCGPSFWHLYRRSAQYVDKILKGANPADMSVQTPWEFEVVINLKTAQALGLRISPTLLFQADEVIR
jgi:putative tryptophan/tyrosine transport system substrate-binding protein